jgi:hypothetical protein
VIWLIVREFLVLKSNRNHRDAELIGLQALGFLAAEEARLTRFLALTGVGPADLRRRAGEPQLLAAVLDHLLADETLLFLFADSAGLDPAEVAAARRRLPGGTP